MVTILVFMSDALGTQRLSGEVFDLKFGHGLSFLVSAFTPSCSRVSVVLGGPGRPLKLGTYIELLTDHVHYILLLLRRYPQSVVDVNKFDSAPDKLWLYPACARTFPAFGIKIPATKSNSLFQNSGNLIVTY